MSKQNFDYLDTQVREEHEKKSSISYGEVGAIELFEEMVLVPVCVLRKLCFLQCNPMRLNAIQCDF